MKIDTTEINKRLSTRSLILRNPTVQLWKDNKITAAYGRVHSVNRKDVGSRL